MRPRRLHQADAGVNEARRTARHSEELEHDPKEGAGHRTRGDRRMRLDLRLFGALQTCLRRFSRELHVEARVSLRQADGDDGQADDHYCEEAHGHHG
jgi:hypothetical protein